MRRLKRRLSQKRLLRLASWLFAVLAVVYGVFWINRGLRPALECGVLDALRSANWSTALTCLDLAEYDAVFSFITLLLSFVTGKASRTAPDTPLGEYHPTTREQENNRKGMIDRVWAIWIEGHLDQTLYQAVPMSLGMTLRPAAPRPGSVRLRRAGEAERPVPEHVSTVELFDQAGHMLLILGEPGSGKTTMMLDLTRSLLERARNGESTPIPVIFNLSSLTGPEQSLDDWLVGEFRSNYQVPEKVARHWLAHRELALLLDGLDEVRADRRAGVVEKIDHYRSQHMDPWLVICCRQNEYAELIAEEAAVESADALVLQPLTEGQIKSYLTDLTGPQPQQLWRALQGDDVLLALADTPLMLNVMLLAAEQLDWSALPSKHGREAVRSHIYDAYIRGMLARPRKAGMRYPDDKTLYWLHWLAGKMVGHGQTIFLLERMKRSWFNQPWQLFSWGLSGGLVFGLVPGLVYGLIYGLTVGLVYGLIGGLIVALFVGQEDIVVQEQIHVRLDKRVLIPGLTFGLIVGLIDGLINGLIVGLFVALIYGLLEQSTAFESNYSTSRPNSAIRQSLHNGLIFGLSSGLIFGLASRMASGVISGPGFEPFIVLFSGLLFGWATVIKHYTLRLVLFLDGSMPLNYVRFLDYCVDRVLLRRVGGGYIFIHRTMMEHIAGLDLEKWKEQDSS